MLGKAPKVWQLERLIRHCNEGGVQAGLPDGRWVHNMNRPDRIAAVLEKRALRARSHLTGEG